MLQLREFSCFPVIFMIVLLSSAEENYCDICPDHTMCLYKNIKPVCNAKLYGIKPQQKYEILNVHNKYRQHVASGNERRGKPGPQPSAKNMPNLVWDDELATVAQRWANQCQYAHDKCRNVKRFGVGQNVAEHTTTGLKIARLEEMATWWYEEVKLFDSAQVQSVTNFERVGHYTQMLWAETTKIGCGFVNYLNGKEEKALFVCNYGPKGNLREEKVYEVVEKNQEEITNQDLVEKVLIEKKPVKTEVLKRYEEKTSNQDRYSTDLRNVFLHAKTIISPFIKIVCRSK